MAGLSLAMPAIATETSQSLLIKGLSGGEFSSNARLVEPDENQKIEGRSDKLVLITHGTLAHFEMEIVTKLQELLKAEGIASLANNLTLGQNDRMGMYDCAIPANHTHEDGVIEINAWLAWINETLPQYTKLYQIGHSRGGNQVAQSFVGTDNATVLGSILIAPMTWELQSENDKANLALADKAKSGEFISVNRHIYCDQAMASSESIHSYSADNPNFDTPFVLQATKKPVLVFAGGDDSVVNNLPEKMTILENNPLVRLITIEGADHLFLDFYIEDVVNDSISFIDEINQ